MQKKILFSLFWVMLAGIMLTTVTIYIIQTAMAYSSARDTCDIYLEDVEKAMEKNDNLIRVLSDTLKEDYLYRTRALADIIELDPSIAYDFDRLMEIQTRLDADEIHIMDENGIIESGTVKEWYGYDFASAEQTIPFLAILDDPTLEIAQDPMISGVGVLRQYIGVARKDKKGFLELGLLPSRLENALRETTIDKVLENIHVGDTGYVFSCSADTGLVTYHPNDALIAADLSGALSDIGFAAIDGINVFYKADDYKDMRLYTVLPLTEMYRNRTFYTGVFFVFSVVLFGMSCVITMLFIKNNVINGIYRIESTLGKISAGNLGVYVDERSNAEFIVLSNGINSMLDRINKGEKLLSEQQSAILSGIRYAQKIQTNLLPPRRAMEDAFSDCSVIWEPRDVVGGDIYWLKRLEEGTVLCFCDCTGHGMPGALLSMIVVSALEAAVRPRNCRDTAEIIWQIERRLVEAFSVKYEGREKSGSDIQDGCDLAVLFIEKDGNIVLSSGNINVFVCDGVGVQRIKGQKIYVGEGSINGKEDIKTVHIPANPGNKLYIASDGLFEQPGGEDSAPFGYKRLENIILKNHGEQQSFISAEIWRAFEEYRGEEIRVDDFQLVTFKP